MTTVSLAGKKGGKGVDSLGILLPIGQEKNGSTKKGMSLSKGASDVMREKKSLRFCSEDLLYSKSLSACKVLPEIQRAFLFEGRGGDGDCDRERYWGGQRADSCDVT